MNEKLENKDFDDLIRGRYEGQEISPPDELWNKVSERVHQLDKKRYKRRFGFLLLFTFSLIAVIGGMIIFYEMSEPTVVSNVDTESNYLPEKTSPATPADSTEKNNTDQAILHSGQSTRQSNEQLNPALNSGKKDKVPMNDRKDFENPVHHSSTNTGLTNTLIQIEEKNGQLKKQKPLLNDPENMISYAPDSKKSTPNNSSETASKHKEEPFIKNQGTEISGIKANNSDRPAVKETKRPENLLNTKVDDKLANVDENIEKTDAVKTDEVAKTNLEPENKNPVSIAGDPEITEAAASNSIAPESNDGSIAPPKTKGEARMTLSAIFLPGYSYRFISTNDNSVDKNAVNAREKGGITYNFGLIAGYKLNEHWSIKSGVTYSSYTQSYSENNSHILVDTNSNEFELNTSIGKMLLSYPEPEEGEEEEEETAEVYVNVNTSDKLQIIHVPVTTQYIFGKGKIKYLITGGISANFLVSHKQEVSVSGSTSLDNSAVKQITSLRSSNFSGVIGFGAEFSLFKGLSFVAQPSFNFSFTSVNKNNPINVFPYTMGLLTGLKYSFK